MGQLWSQHSQNGGLLNRSFSSGPFMTNSISMTQPAMALPQSIVTTGSAPSASGSYQDYDTLGIIITTAYDPSSFSYVTQALGQELNIADATSLYQSIGRYFGQPSETTFNLPDLSGRMALTLTSSSNVGSVKLSGYNGSIAVGSVQGSYGNPVLLTQSQLPDSFGGSSAAISNMQYAQGVSYIIQVYGEWPSAEGGLPNQSLGAIFPFVGDVIPKGFMLCSGQTIPIEDNEALYALFGNTYGGNQYAEVPTMGLPNLISYIPVGAATGTGIGVISGSSAPTIAASSVTSGNAGTVSTSQPSITINYLINASGVTNSFNYYQPTLGQIIMFAGYQNSDDEWIICNGQFLKIASYQSLYNLIGTTFGGDGITTFAVPDLRGKTIVGSGGTSGLSIGQLIGQATVTVTPDYIPDITVPAPGLTLVDDTGASSSDNVTSTTILNVNGLWPNATVQYSTDGITWSSTFEAQEGAGIVYARQLDPAGQASGASTALNYVNDTTSPVTPSVTLDYDTTASIVASGGENDLATQSGSLVVKDLEAGADLIYSIDGGLTWREHFEAKIGLNNVQLKQVDRAGNSSAASSPISFFRLGYEDQKAMALVVKGPDGENQIVLKEPGIIDASLGTSSVDMIQTNLQSSISLPNNIENITLSGIGAGNTITGNELSNKFHVVAGSWTIKGSLGHDSVIFDGSVGEYMIQQNISELTGSAVVTVLGDEGKVILNDIENIIFKDIQLQETSSPMVKSIYALYQGLLNRMPDFQGLSAWRGALESGLDFNNIISAFLISNEYLARNGTGQSDVEFVQGLYQHTLQRLPERDETNAWVSALKSDSLQPIDVVLSIIGSPEAARLKLTTEFLEPF